jgi:deazaflavin-dependent oxidoreductase (nitroreductase family)
MPGSHTRIRAFNKNIFNPLMLKFAGTAHNPFAVVHHVGRRSGKEYQTPIIVRATAGGFVVDLTYGPEVDWYRNLLAAGRATLVWHGRAYVITQPQPLDVQTGLAAFPLPLRLILLALRREHFITVQSQRVG